MKKKNMYIFNKDMGVRSVILPVKGWGTGDEW